MIEHKDTIADEFYWALDGCGEVMPVQRVADDVNYSSEISYYTCEAWECLVPASAVIIISHIPKPELT